MRQKSYIDTYRSIQVKYFQLWEIELNKKAFLFNRPVILEVPHYASLRGKEREIVILRSDNGTSWREHNADATDDVVQDILHETLEIEGKLLLSCSKTITLLSSAFDWQSLCSLNWFSWSLALWLLASIKIYRKLTDKFSACGRS